MITRMAATIAGRRLAMLRDFRSPDPVKNYRARAEWAEAAREKTLLVGMAANPLMWNPLGAMMVGGYAAGKFMSNYMRLRRD
jgi:hypothetical protein